MNPYKLHIYPVFCLLIISIITIGCKKDLKTDTTENQILKFNFGTEEIESFITLDESIIYNDSLGYGFDYASKVKISQNNNLEHYNKQQATSDSSFYFSVKLPEGHYNIAVTLGGATYSCNTTVKAESRRLMLENIKIGAEEIIQKEFTVNVRTPKINDSTSIRLKSREHGYLNWDNKLTLEFCGTNPSVCAIEIEKIIPEQVIYLAGNSTVTDQNNEPWASWGQMFTRFIIRGISVANYAESGEALHSFFHAKRLEKVLSLIKPGDYLFIEFAHNDQKRKGDGIGPWGSYSNYLRQYIDSARNKGATPILITSMHRRNFNEQGEIINTLGDYPAAMRAIAKEKNVALIDLNEMSKDLYEAWGVEGSKKGFVHYPANTFPGQDEALKDNTHFNNYGAYHIAMCILWDIKRQQLPISKFLLKDAVYFAPDQHIPFTNWDLPQSGMATNIKPDGN